MLNFYLLFFKKKKSFFVNNKENKISNEKIKIVKPNL